MGKPKPEAEQCHADDCAYVHEVDLVQKKCRASGQWQTCGLTTLCLPRRSSDWLSGQSGFNLLVCLELSKGVNRPYCRWQPSDQSALEKEANQTGYGPANSEKGGEGKKNGEKQTHGTFLLWWWLVK